jgi:hypothetical protein
MSKRIGLLTTAFVVVAGLGLYGVAQAKQNTLVTKMSGAQEVDPNSGEPGAGDPDGAGTAKIKLFSDTDQVCFNLHWSNIGAPTMSHIHEAAKGANGGVVVTLFSSQNPLPDTITGVNGCASGVDDTLSERIRKSPSDFYVNIHNSEYPGGAIRGQLRYPPR